MREVQNSDGGGVREAGACLEELSQLLQRLIRFETVNPPGNEAECIRFIAGLLEAAGFSPQILGKSPERPNLVVKLPGRGLNPPLLMHGHVDVVTTRNQDWTHPPFEGVEVDGFIWGRGALDMKSGVVMMVAALMRMRRESITPNGDVILAVTCDEEDGGSYGAKYLIEEHPGLFQGVRFAIGELGGFTLHLAGKRFYPIMISEKQRCSVRVTLTGPGGHGALPRRGGPMAELSRILRLLDTRRLPVHVTAPVRMMLNALSDQMPFPYSLLFRQLANPLLTDTVLRLLGANSTLLDPLLHNTVNPTILRGGEMINVVPGEITLDLDGRILPGFSEGDIIPELRSLIGDEAAIEVTYFSPGPQKVDLGLFKTLGDILREQDPQGIPVPFVGSGISDARFFSKLGIQSYGFTPMLLPKEIDFASLIHGADERIPVEALKFGADAVYQLLMRA